jgi:UV DNA damage endonuclease
MKIGGCCILLDEDLKVDRALNMHTSTVSHMMYLSAKDKNAHLFAMVQHNLRALRRQVKHFATLPEHLRMWRISSELLPFYMHPLAASFYAVNECKEYIAGKLEDIGRVARNYGVRLSFHPAQFVTLASQNANVRKNAAQELDYHGQVFEMMGYRGWHEDGTSINIHIGPKDAAIKEMRALIKSAPDYVKNFLTIENDEFSWTVKPILDAVGDLVPVVLDVHHYWIFHKEYLDPSSNLVSDIKDTWRGVRPKLHLALSAPDLCGGAGKNTSLSITDLLTSTSRTKLRAHSLEPWHHKTVKYAASFGFDIMWEGKNKNVGAKQISKILKLGV